MSLFPRGFRLPPHDLSVAVLGPPPHHALAMRRRPADVTGRPVVFVHGCCGNGGLLWEITPDGRPGWASLALESGCETVVLDLPGHGRAAPPPDFATMGLDRAVDALTQLLREIGPAVLVGHSMGGSVVTRTLGALPPEQRGLVSAVVLVDPARVSGMPVVTLNADLGADLATRLLPASHARDLAAPAPFYPVELVECAAGWHAPESGRSMAEMVLEGFGPPPDPEAYQGIPTLLLAAEWELGVGAGTIGSYRDFFGLEVTTVADLGLPGHGHGMVTELGNEFVAAHVLDWIAARA